MAVGTSDNLFAISQNFFSSDVLKKISNETDQSEEQTRVGLKSIIPTLLMGIANKASTREGAESIANMANRQVSSSGYVEPETSSSVGTDFVSSIFGSNLGSVISRLGTATGMTTSNVSKMLTMAAPVVMGVIGSKMKSERMSVSGLMSFLGQQKSALASLIPSGIAGLSTAVFSSGSTSIPVTSSSSFGWVKYVLIALAILAALWWLFAKNIPVKEINMEALRGNMTMTSDYNAADIQGLNALEEYMKTPAIAGASKRFRFENLNFDSGSTALVAGAEAEISQIVTAMKAYPMTTATVEGYTDNIGSAELNENLSLERAMKVKEMLVSRGIAANRVEAMGRGQSNPIANNETASGRLTNRRIEFVIHR